jgi:hypothetical protein
MAQCGELRSLSTTAVARRITNAAGSGHSDGQERKGKSTLEEG